jgi:hypothetical protein
MTDQDEEIEQLQKENQRLRAQLARAGVTVLPSVDLPTPSELDRIVAKILSAYPVLNSPEVSKAEVANAIHFLTFVFRTEKVNTDRSTGYWTDCATEWLRAQGLHPASMGLRSFIVAVIASGISFTLDKDNFPFGISFGINLGSASKPSNAWRRTLESVPRPVESENYLRPVERNIQMVRETIKL